MQEMTPLVGKVIRSHERVTGMGARNETQVYHPGSDVAGVGSIDEGWYALSDWPQARHVGRENGFEVWEAGLSELEAEVRSPVRYRAYHRSNSGNVTTAEGSECLGY